ncbi:MAG: hypothetical protein V1834_04470 [Candidatus Micrarchaeota archaeon]
MPERKPNPSEELARKAKEAEDKELAKMRQMQIDIDHINALVRARKFRCGFPSNFKIGFPKR